MKAVTINISLNPELAEFARADSKARAFDSMSEYVRDLIRDLKDDPYLACALAAGAKIIVTRDGDLLAMGKPFGIQIVTPRELLVRLSKPL
jgi:predicted nucleic acid-binding protein